MTNPAGETVRTTGPIRREDITGVILAGGLGRRMSDDGQGVDKGLQTFRGRAMVAHAIDRLAPQVATIIINANRNADRYQAFGWPVAPDAIEGYAGPLAGLHAGMQRARTRWIVTVPCDSPFFPADLVARLAAALRPGAQAGAHSEPPLQLAVARTGAQAHPVFALMDRTLLGNLEQFLTSGRRKIDAWYAPLRVVEVDFGDPAPFRNLNTRQELLDEELPGKLSGNPGSEETGPDASASGPHGMSTQ